MSEKPKNPPDSGAANESSNGKLIANAASVSVKKNSPTRFTLTSPNLGITFSVEGRPKFGTLDESSLPNLLYTPSPDYVGYDYLEFVVRDKKNNTSDKARITLKVYDARGREPAALEATLMEFGKTVISNSLATLKGFIDFMVPLTTALITAYIALLQFLGVASLENLSSFARSNLITPPALMLVSLIAFIFAAFPIPRSIALSPSSVEAYRRDTFNWKYTGSAIGGIFFIIGVSIMIANIIPLIGPQQEIQEILPVYVNPAYNYKISYPNYWNISVYDNSKFVVINLPGSIDNPQLGIMVDTISLSEFHDLEELASYRRSLLGENTSAYQTTLSGNPAFNITTKQDLVQTKEIVGIRKDKMYILDYNATKNDYDIYLPTVNKMIDSFKYLE